MYVQPLPDMERTGFDWVSAKGKHYPIVQDSAGNFFTFDPNHEVPGPHLAPLSQSAKLSGLGITTDQGVQAAAQAANFIPVAGPFISAALEVGDAIFGGGDPTALSILINNIVQLRNQIAQANNAMGVADPFTIPAGFNPQNKDAWRNLVDGIVEEALGVTEAQIQKDRRKDYYAAISTLQKGLQNVNAQAIAVQTYNQLNAQHGPTSPVDLPAISPEPTLVTPAATQPPPYDSVTTVPIIGAPANYPPGPGTPLTSSYSPTAIDYSGPQPPYSSADGIIQASGPSPYSPMPPTAAPDNTGLYMLIGGGALLAILAMNR